MTREEAIEVYNGLINTKIKEAFEFFAPELAESEDERIRKALISEIKNCGIKLFESITNEQFVAWLEKQGEQKPAWSKEDEKVSNNILYILNQLKDNAIYNAIYNEDDIAKECIDWIYSIKDRVLPKQEWSEEDERLMKNLKSTLANLSARKLIERETEEKYVSWLKSIRLQNRWRPSKEQIEALEVAVKHCDRSDYRVTHTHTKELLEQLKKL